MKIFFLLCYYLIYSFFLSLFDKYCFLECLVLNLCIMSVLVYFIFHFIALTPQTPCMGLSWVCYCCCTSLHVLIKWCNIFNLTCAGYYSYLYAKCFATTIWQRICQEDPLSLDTGLALRTKFLQHGGAKDPADILNDLVGSGIIRNCSGGIIPDITSLCEEMELMKH